MTNWDVMGLRATGSIDYSSDGLFVAEPFSYIATNQTSRSAAARSTRGDRRARRESATPAGRSAVGPPLPRRAARPDRGPQRPPGTGSPTATASTTDYATAEGKMRAARAFVYRRSGARIPGDGALRRAALTRAEHAPRLRAAERHEPPRSRVAELRLRRRRHRGASRRRDPALLPRHPRGRPAPGLLAAGPPGRRARAGGLAPGNEEWLFMMLRQAQLIHLLWGRRMRDPGWVHAPKPTRAGPARLSRPLGGARPAPATSAGTASASQPGAIRCTPATWGISRRPAITSTANRDAGGARLGGPRAPPSARRSRVGPRSRGCGRACAGASACCAAAVTPTIIGPRSVMPAASTGSNQALKRSTS